MFIYYCGGTKNYKTWVSARSTHEISVSLFFGKLRNLLDRSQHPEMKKMYLLNEKNGMYSVRRLRTSELGHFYYYYRTLQKELSELLKSSGIADPVYVRNLKAKMA